MQFYKKFRHSSSGKYLSFKNILIDTFKPTFFLRKYVRVIKMPTIIHNRCTTTRLTFSCTTDPLTTTEENLEVVASDATLDFSSLNHEVLEIFSVMSFTVVSPQTLERNLVNSECYTKLRSECRSRSKSNKSATYQKIPTPRVSRNTLVRLSFSVCIECLTIVARRK